MRGIALLAALLAASATQAGEKAQANRIDLDHSIGLTLPANWQGDGEASAPIAYDLKGYCRLQVVCRSETCRHS